MKLFNTARHVAIAALLAVSGTALAVSALAADTAPAAKAAPADRKAEMEKHRQEFFKQMSDRMADRLEIKPSQQAPFQAYTAVLQSAMTPAGSRPEYKSDAASIARMNADRAAEHAKRLAAVADATAKFQEALSPDQRKTFDQMAAAFTRRHHGRRHGFGHGHGWGHDGEHGGEHERQDGHGDRGWDGNGWHHEDNGQHS